MSPGKLAAQVSHASVASLLTTGTMMRCSDEALDWVEGGMTKVVVQVSDEETLLAIYNKAKKAGLPCSLICDEGRTELPPHTYTCCGIGPADPKAINKITGSLKLY